ncbi:hypothetical protein HDU92_002794 [Lobulomyces angularis]|nr:hypothetical protein HDU92_002794 [Lobulomyces angularis]
MIANASTHLIIGISVSLTSSMLASLGINLQASALVSIRERNSLAELESQEEDSDSEINSNCDDEESVFNILQSGIHLRSNSICHTPELRDSQASEARIQKILDLNESPYNTKQFNIPPELSLNLDVFSSSQLDRDQLCLIREGNISQSDSEIRSKKKSDFSIENRWKLFFFQWQWYLGFLLYLLCQLLGSVTALNFIPPEIVAPLGATGLIFNMLFSKAFLGTSIIRKDWVGTLLIVIGCAIVSVSGSNNSGDVNEKKTIEDIISVYSKPQFIIYFIIQSSAVIFMFCFVKYLEYGGPLKRSHESENITFEDSQSRISFSIPHEQLEEAQDCINQEASENSPLLVSSQDSRKRLFRRKSSLSNTTSNRVSRWLRRKKRSFKLVGLIGTLYSIIGGIAASDTLILANNGIELLFYLFSKKEVEYILFPVLLLSSLVITIILQLYSLNQGLNFSLPTFVVPLFYTFYTIFSFSNSLIVNSSGEKKNGEELSGEFGLILCGLVLIVMGVWLLGSKAEASTDDVEDEAKKIKKKKEKIEDNLNCSDNSNNSAKSVLENGSHLIEVEEEDQLQQQQENFK